MHLVNIPTSLSTCDYIHSLASQHTSTCRHSIRLLVNVPQPWLHVPSMHTDGSGLYIFNQKNIHAPSATYQRIQFYNQLLSYRLPWSCSHFDSSMKEHCNPSLLNSHTYDGCEQIFQLEWRTWKEFLYYVMFFCSVSCSQTTRPWVHTQLTLDLYIPWWTANRCCYKGILKEHAFVNEQALHLWLDTQRIQLDILVISDNIYCTEIGIISTYDNKLNAHCYEQLLTNIGLGS